MFYGIQQRLEESIARHKSPSASVAILHKGKILTAAAGYLNMQTKVEATTDSIYQIGSTTKPFTATLAMMLIDEGRLRIDDRVVDHLPEFTLSDAGAAREIRIKHLLCHTNGIDGDRITDTGNTEDAVAKLVAGLKDAEVLHPPGSFLSYSNVGYIVLGRILEVIEGEPWDKILRRRLLIPLGLKTAVTSAEEALAQHTAMGHELAADGSLQLAASAFAPRSNGPSGTTLAMSAADLIRFAKFHLDDGVTATGKRLLSEKSCRIMRQLQISTPLSSRYTGWGFGWMLFGWNNADVFGHDGGWSGQASYLRLSPRAGLAIAVLVNGGFTAGVFRDIARPVLQESAGFHLPAPLEFGPAYTGDLAPYAGRYSRFGQTVELAVRDKALTGALSGPYVGDKAQSLTVTLTDRERAVCTIEGISEPVGAYFLDFDPNGRPAYFHVTERAFKREK